LNALSLGDEYFLEVGVPGFHPVRMHNVDALMLSTEEPFASTLS
jgi:hypothetical protein